MRILGLTVGRNEADRYLSPMLSNISPALDGHLFFDDRSNDDTRQIAVKAGCEVVMRPPSVPSFITHEGQFRMAAWLTLQRVFTPRDGDWILAIDCDEFLVAKEELNYQMRSEIAHAVQRIPHTVGLRLPIPEVFAIGPHGRPRIRVDGLWGTIGGPRLFAWYPGGTYSDKAMGSGAEPTYVARGPFQNAQDLWLMHYGYAHTEDQKAKHERYTALDNHGHLDAHVQSILTTPKLEDWHGPYIPMGERVRG
jgi:Glycosyl transferase family 2